MGQLKHIKSNKSDYDTESSEQYFKDIELWQQRFSKWTFWQKFKWFNIQSFWFQATGGFYGKLYAVNQRVILFM